MKTITKLLLLCAICVFSAGICLADTIIFATRPSQIGFVRQPGYIDIDSPDLNGLVLSGQHLSLDLSLGGDVLARTWMLTPNQFCVLLMVFTDAPSFPGQAGASTGFLLDSNGQQIIPARIAGREDADDGSFGLGLVSFTAKDFNGVGVLDIGGAHFDTLFPDTGYTVTNSVMRLGFWGENRMELGTVEQLPEPSSLMTVLIGIGGMAFPWFRKKQKGHQ